MINVACYRITEWIADEAAAAAAEFALVFPVMFTMMVGIWDLGNGIVVNQKAIAASQIVIDLICREESVTDAEITGAFEAGALALMPYDTTNFKVEVASVEYDADDDPVALWQETSDSSAIDPTLVGRATGLGTDGEGAVVVQVTYEYTPSFSGTVIGTISMNERVFSRGRQSTLVVRE